MQICLLVVGVSSLIGMFCLIRAAFTAPEAIEDDRGFHFLDANDSERYSYFPPVALSEGDVIFFK